MGPPDGGLIREGDILKMRGGGLIRELTVGVKKLGCYHCVDVLVTAPVDDWVAVCTGEPSVGRKYCRYCSNTIVNTHTSPPGLLSVS